MILRVLLLLATLAALGLAAPLTPLAAASAAAAARAAAQPAAQPAAAQPAGAEPLATPEQAEAPVFGERTAPPRTLRAYWHVFIAFAVTWLLLFGYVISLGRRWARLERELDAWRRETTGP